MLALSDVRKFIAPMAFASTAFDKDCRRTDHIGRQIKLFSSDPIVHATRTNQWHITSDFYDPEIQTIQEWRLKGNIASLISFVQLSVFEASQPGTTLIDSLYPNNGLMELWVKLTDGGVATRTIHVVDQAFYLKKKDQIVTKTPFSSITALVDSVYKLAATPCDFASLDFMRLLNLRKTFESYDEPTAPLPKGDHTAIVMRVFCPPATIMNFYDSEATGIFSVFIRHIISGKVESLPLEDWNLRRLTVLENGKPVKKEFESHSALAVHVLGVRDIVASVMINNSIAEADLVVSYYTYSKTPEHQGYIPLYLYISPFHTPPSISKLEAGNYFTLLTQEKDLFIIFGIGAGQASCIKIDIGEKLTFASQARVKELNDIGELTFESAAESDVKEAHVTLPHESFDHWQLLMKALTAANPRSFEQQLVNLNLAASALKIGSGIPGRSLAAV